MQVAGILPEDAPDPALESWAKAREFPLTVVGLRAQPAIELFGPPGLGWSAGGGGKRDMTISLTYSLYRNPDDRSDPVNLADLDDSTRASLDKTPPWPRPTWLIEQVERMRYRTLWEAAKTSWHRDEANLGEHLLHHVNHVLRNRFREERGLSGPYGYRSAPEVTVNAIQHGVPVLLDGAEVIGARIDTDPHVFGIGATTGENGLFTAVLPRDELDYLTMEFSSQPVDALRSR